MTPPDRQALMAAITRVKQSLERIYENCSQKGKTDNDYLQQAIGVSHALDLLGGSEITAALAEAAPASDRQALMGSTDALTDAACFIDSLKDSGIREGWWSDWDQATRNKITAALKANYALAEAAPAGTGTQVGKVLDWLRRASKAIYAAIKQVAADDISAGLLRAATALETIARERDRLQAANTISDRIVGELNTEVMALEDTIAELRAQLDARPTTASRETQATVSDWCEATFGAAHSNARVAARANEEMAELLKDLTRNDADAHSIEEAADVVIILYRLAARMGLDLHAELDRKMSVNRSRKWNVGPDGHGYHVKDAALAIPRSPAAPEPEKP